MWKIVFESELHLPFLITTLSPPSASPPISPLPPLITRGKLSLFYRQICSFGKRHTRCMNILPECGKLCFFFGVEKLVNSHADSITAE